MKLVCYPKLSTRTKRLMLQTTNNEGKKYEYVPTSRLVLRLAHELSREPRVIRELLEKERRYLLAEGKPMTRKRVPVA